MSEAVKINRSHPEFYINRTNIPKPFLAADKQCEERHKNDPIPVKKVKKVPMPFIAGSDGINGPIIVTEDWYLKKKKKQIKERSKDLKETQIEMMQLLSKKDRLKFKIGELDPSKKKDGKKIIALNVEIKNIEAELEMLQSQSGINLNKLEKGSRLARFMGNSKRFIKKKIIKPIKKWFRRNKELILGLISIIVPAMLALTTIRAATD